MVRSLGTSCQPQPLGQTNPLTEHLRVQVRFRLLSFPPLCTQLSPFGFCVPVAAVVCTVFSSPSSVIASSRRGLSSAGFGSPETLALLEPTLQLFLPGY